MRTRHFLRLLLAAILLPARAIGVPDLPEDRGAAGLWQALLRLRTTASALHVTAHPDDEDGPTLTLLARGHGARTMLLSLTRGEGGANLIAPFFFDALGVLRTLELLESDRRYGVEQFFTRAADYGFSKVLDEALRSWGGEEEVLRDVVRVVRRERPDVIISRFRGDANDGHGHHSFAGLMARRAFDAAGDPARFPEQIAEGLRPWKPRKLYMNNINPAWRSEDRSLVTLELDADVYSPLLGRSYHQIAREGLSFQRSQGTAAAPPLAGPRPAYYRRVEAEVAGDPPAREASFFDGLDTTIAGIAGACPDPPSWLRGGLEALHRAVESAADRFDPLDPSKVVEPLVEGLKESRKLLERVRASDLAEGPRDHIRFLLERKEKQLENAIARGLGIEADFRVRFGPARGGPPGSSSGGPSSESPPFDHAIPGQKLAARFQAVNRSRLPVQPLDVTLESEGSDDAFKSHPDPWEAKTIGWNEAFAAQLSIEVSADAPPTRPHWRRASIHETLYRIEDPRHHTYPFPPPPVTAAARLSVLGESITLRVPLSIPVEHPGRGTRLEPLTVVPAISVAFTTEHGIVPAGKDTHRVSVELRSSVKGPARGTLRMVPPEGWSSDPSSWEFAFEKENETAIQDFAIRVGAEVGTASRTIEAVASLDGREYREGFTTITAADLPRFNLYKPARHHVRRVDVRLPEALRIGYIMGSGDEVPGSLELLGVRPEMLGPGDLPAKDLSGYDSIIIGVRAYAVRPDLGTWNARLLEYVKEGGVLLVQYQTPEFDRNYGPYPYSMSSNPEEVSEQDSALAILEPENPIFTTPNRITPEDFEGWVEERGSKFWRSWDPKYTALLESFDRGQEPQRGGMLYARYGKGAYIYSAYAWYRQLPQGVPGAFRIYANMISLRRALHG